MPFYLPFNYSAPDFRLNFTGNQVKFIIEYKNCDFFYAGWRLQSAATPVAGGYGEIGRRAGFRFQWGNP